MEIFFKNLELPLSKLNTVIPKLEEFMDKELTAGQKMRFISIFSLICQAAGNLDGMKQALELQQEFQEKRDRENKLRRCEM